MEGPQTHVHWSLYPGETGHIGLMHLAVGGMGMAPRLLWPLSPCLGMWHSQHVLRASAKEGRAALASVIQALVLHCERSGTPAVLDDEAGLRGGKGMRAETEGQGLSHGRVVRWDHLQSGV